MNSISKFCQGRGRLFEFKRGERIYSEGDQPLGLYLVESGLVGLNLLGAQSGREHLLRFFVPGQYFGHRALLSGEGYHGTTIALEKTKLRRADRAEVLSALQKDPTLLWDFVQVLARELRRSETHQVMVLENQILERTAQSLVYLKDLYPEHRWTRQEIANFCASTVATVIKAMAELESRGLISQTGREFQILNREALIQLSTSVNSEHS